MLKGVSKFLFTFLFLILASVFVSPIKAKAISQSSILVNVSPENPAPNENFSITLNSYASNLDSVLISWSVNGSVALSGIGKKTFSSKAPDAGNELNIVVSISLPDGSIDKRITIRPAVMTLLWQANDSYTPPFYKGKALPTPESEIKIVAIPEIRNNSQITDPKNMTYAWKKDYTNNVDGSGYGRNYFLYVNDYLEDSGTISVTASTVDQKYSSQASIDVPTSEAKIVFYKKDDKFGTVWEHALLDGHTVVDSEIVEASPYFISPFDIRIPLLVFNWYINDTQIPVPIFKKNIMPLKVQAGTSGTSILKLEIESTDKIFSNTSKQININF
ncbi:hypothetical protein IT399_02290 [Candidatus Nomurabacteria bacterium]|nr:hypothetical protein [Candidatus Nomurabacteria bacterium]